MVGDMLQILLSVLFATSLLVRLLEYDQMQDPFLVPSSATV